MSRARVRYIFIDKLRDRAVWRSGREGPAKGKVGLMTFTIYKTKTRHIFFFLPDADVFFYAAWDIDLIHFYLATYNNYRMI